MYALLFLLCRCNTTGYLLSSAFLISRLCCSTFPDQGYQVNQNPQLVQNPQISQESGQTQQQNPPVYTYQQYAGYPMAQTLPQFSYGQTYPFTTAYGFSFDIIFNTSFSI